MDKDNDLNGEESEELIQKNECKTPEKKDKPLIQTNDSTPVKERLTPVKEQNKCESNIFKTPEKTTQSNKSVCDKVERGVRSDDKTPEKTCENLNLTSESKTESDSFIANDGEEGLISTTEQARLLIAASKTPSKTPSKSTPVKYTYKTPVKNGTPSGKRSAENSPYTPGKHKRADLITLSSPKMKRLKQI